MLPSIEQALSAGIAALPRMQADDGSFPLWRRKPAGRWTPCGSVFSTVSVLLAVRDFLPPRSVDRATRFVRAQRGQDRLWNYDPMLGVPPDSDCTACALAVLAVSGARNDLSDGASLLRSFWREGNGPFQTWRGDETWSRRNRDDPVVNCNVILALKAFGAAPSATELDAVGKLVQASSEGARYYVAPAAIAYAARRAGLPDTILPPIACSRPPPERLLACIHWLIATGRRDEELIRAVLGAQQEDGSFPVWPWCREIAGNVWGSPAVTTALAVELLTGIAGEAG